MNKNIIEANYDNLIEYQLKFGKTHNIWLVAIDKRNKSYEQIRFMYYIIKQFCFEINGTKEPTEVESIKYALYEDYCKAVGRDFYRTQTSSITDMRLFINWLLKFLATEYSFSIALDHVHDDFIQQWTYAMVMARKCVVCGANGADIHHIDRVGMGRNRKNMDHSKKRVISLCRKHHSEVHNGSNILTKLMLNGIILSDFDLNFLKIGKKN